MKVDVKYDVERPKETRRGRPYGKGQYAEVRKAVARAVERYIGPGKPLPSPNVKVKLGGVTGNKIEAKLKSAKREVYQFVNRRLQAKTSGWCVCCAKAPDDPSAFYFWFEAYEE